MYVKGSKKIKIWYQSKAIVNITESCQQLFMLLSHHENNKLQQTLLG